MIGYFLTRGLVLAFGYLYPAYECYKSVEMNKPDIEQLRFWCQYWILVAGLTVCERIGDVFIGWIPMYCEAKLAFFVYLWFPKTKGTTYVYDSFFRPYVAKHETEIDRSLVELRTRAADMALLYWQKSASYAQSRIFDILQFIASQSTNKRPAQPQQHKPTSVQDPPAPSNCRLSPTRQPQDVQPPSPVSSTASSSSSYRPEDDTAEETQSSDTAEAVKASPASNSVKTAPATTQALLERTKSLSYNEVKVIKKVDSGDVVLPTTESALPPPPPPPAVQDTVMEEASGRFTRARSRRTRAAAASSFAKIG